MSYYGIKNIKIVKTEDDKYNLSCDYYDSSIRDYNNNRVWYHDDKFFKIGYETKEQLEYALFKDFLDGNFHTSSNCGKFACLSWNNCKVTLPQEQEELISKLSKDYYNSKLPYNSEEREKLRQIYYSARYDLYYKAWLAFLADAKKYRTCKFRIKLSLQDDDKNLTYKDVYVKKLGTRRCGYTYYPEYAKKFTGNPEVIINRLNGYLSHIDIRVEYLNR